MKIWRELTFSEFLWEFLLLSLGILLVVIIWYFLIYKPLEDY